MIPAERARAGSTAPMSGWLPYGGLFAAFVVLLGALGLSYWSMFRALAGFEEVIHKEEEFERYLQLFADLKEAEDWQRQYLLTGEEQLFAPFQMAVARVGQRIAELRAMAADDPAMQGRLEEVEALASERIDLLRNALDRRLAGGVEEALAIVRSGRGALLTDRIRRVILELEIEDMSLLRERHDRAHEAAAFTILSMTAALILFMLTAGVIIWKLRRDLEERRRLERRMLEEAKLAEIARLLGDVGHDVKNMLMPIVNGAELLHQELAEHFARLPEPGIADSGQTRKLSEDILDMTRTCSRRIQERVREIADAVKGRTAPMALGPCHVGRLTDSVLAALRLYAGERGVALRTEGLDKLPMIRADERRLFNALYNLVNNAIPEVPSGGSVTVRGEEDQAGESIVLSVVDTGRGMPPEVRDSLFGYAAITRKPGGTGLGTKIVKDVVEAHGGTVTVESEEGVGTAFHLRLPVAGPAPGAVRAPAPQTRSG